MAMLPKTVGELRKLLETYPDDLPIFVQGETQENPNATPNRFVVEYWKEPECEPPMLLLAGVSPNTFAVWYPKNSPNASFNLPK